MIIGDITEIISGFALKSDLFTENVVGLPIIRIRDVDRGFSNTYTPEVVDPKYLIQNGDFLITMDGEFRMNKWNGGTAILNQRVCKLDVKHKNVFDDYLLYFLPKKLKDIEDKTPFVTVKHLSVKDIKNIEIPLPPLPEQQRIVALLDKADNLRQKRRQSLALMDEFLKSTFLDMFGDPVKNEKGWETRTIEQLVKKQKHSIKRGPFGGALKKEIFVDEGYLVYEQFHALNNDFSFERYYIDEEKFNELKGFEVFPGDIIISCSGVYLGKLAIVPNNAKKGIINQALLKITLDNKIINNEFFVFLFLHDSFRTKFFGDTRGSGIPNFPPIEEFKKFKFIYPPILLQTKFLQIVEKTEAAKEKMKAQLVEMDNNFNGLMAEVFKS